MSSSVVELGCGGGGAGMKDISDLGAGVELIVLMCSSIVMLGFGVDTGGRSEFNKSVVFVFEVAVLVWSKLVWTRVGASDRLQFGPVQLGGHWHVSS